MALIRVIQFFGLLRLPVSFTNLKNYQLYFDLLRLPRQPYTNLKYPVPKGFYGYLQTLYRGRVVQTYALEFENQVVFFGSSDSLYLHSSVSCSLEAVLTSFLNIGNYLQPGYTIQRNNPIKDWSNFRSPIFDEIRVRFLDDRVIGRLTFDWETVDTCTVPESELPPPPKDLPPSLPSPPTNADTPNSALPNISSAYDGGDDGGLTYNPTPDGGGGGDGQGECIAYEVKFAFDRLVSENNGTPTLIVGGILMVNLFGPIGQLTSAVVGNMGSIKIISRGYTFAACQSSPIQLSIWEETIAPNITSFQYLNVRIISIMQTSP